MPRRNPLTSALPSAFFFCTPHAQPSLLTTDRWRPYIFAYQSPRARNRFFAIFNFAFHLWRGRHQNRPSSSDTHGHPLRAHERHHFHVLLEISARGRQEQHPASTKNKASEGFIMVRTSVLTCEWMVKSSLFVRFYFPPSLISPSIYFRAWCCFSALCKSRLPLSVYLDDRSAKLDDSIRLFTW